MTTPLFWASDHVAWRLGLETGRNELPLKMLEQLAWIPKAEVLECRRLTSGPAKLDLQEWARYQLGFQILDIIRTADLNTCIYHEDHPLRLYHEMCHTSMFLTAQCIAEAGRAVIVIPEKLARQLEVDAGSCEATPLVMSKISLDEIGPTAYRSIVQSTWDLMIPETLLGLSWLAFPVNIYRGSEVIFRGDLVAENITLPSIHLLLDILG